MTDNVFELNTNSSIKIEDLNVREEVKDYIINIHETEEVYFHEYPKDLKKYWGFVIPCETNNEIESEIFNMYEILGFKIFNNSIAKYELCDESENGYIVMNKDNKVILIKCI